MEQKTDNRKPSMIGNTMLFVAGILFCLVLISTAMLGGLFARYTAGSSGSDSARVVQFGDLTMTETGDFVGEERKAIVTPGVDLKKEIVVEFEASEVAAIVFVQVTAPGWTVTDDRQYSLNGKLSWTLADGWEYLEGDEVTGEYVYYKALAPNTPLTADVIAEIAEGSDTHIKVATTITEADIDALLEDLQLGFRAAVIQNDGSLTPETAWERLD